MNPVFVIIRSGIGRQALRAAVRNTWLPDLTWPYAFYVGSGYIGTDPDIVSLPQVYDGVGARERLTVKTHYAMKHALEQHPSHYYFLTNDTTYIAADRLRASDFVGFDYKGRAFESGHLSLPYIDDSAVWFSHRALVHLVDSQALKNIEKPEADAYTGKELNGKFLFTNDFRYGIMRTAGTPRVNNDLISGRAHTPELMYQAHRIFTEALK